MHGEGASYLAPKLVLVRTDTHVHATHTHGHKHWVTRN